MAYPDFRLNALEREVNGGWVSKRQHPEFPYWVYNYTQKTTNERHWNPVTEQCRGLILDHQGKIIARPFCKFFTVHEWTEVFGRDIPDEPFTVSDKLDGSLGISYIGPDGKAYIATRGSFESEQAIRGTAFLQKELSDSKELKPGIT